MFSKIEVVREQGTCAAFGVEVKLQRDFCSTPGGGGRQIRAPIYAQFLCVSTREGTAGARNVGREENEEREDGTEERWKGREQGTLGWNGQINTPIPQGVGGFVLPLLPSFIFQSVFIVITSSSSLIPHLPIFRL